MVKKELTKEEEEELTQEYLYDLIKKQRKEIEQMKRALFHAGLMK